MLQACFNRLLRNTIGLLACASILLAEQPTIRTSVPLVVAPASVIDRQGHPVPGLKASDFELLDEGTVRPAKVTVTDDGELPPVAAVIVVQTSDISLSALGKIRKVGSLTGNAVASNGGEIAIVTFDSEIKIVQDFTGDASDVSAAFTRLQPSNNGNGRMIDAVAQALEMLKSRPGPRRPIIVLISESKDRGSTTKLDALTEKLGRSATTIYSLTYSAYLTPFTTKASEYQPPEGGGLLKAITETARLGKANTIASLTEATGGLQFGFATKAKLESDLLCLEADVHSRDE